MQVPELSLVVPFFNEEAGLAAFFERVVPIVEGLGVDYEIVCVDDGSEDRTGELLAARHRRDPRVKLLRLSRNFGKERALTAGLDHAQGRAVIPIDADLQDPPELIPQLVARWREGFDVVLAVRADRQCDTLLKRLTARLFYRVMGRMADVPIPADVGDFRLLDRRVVDALKLLPERTRFMKGLFAWLGFRQARVAYRRAPRVAGASRWPWWRLWNFALEGLFSFSTLPLRVWTYAGLLVTVGALLFAAAIVGRTVASGIDVPGYASLDVLVSLFGGINMIGLGIIGEYLGRVFTEVKGRPNYLVRDRLGFGEHAQPERGGLPRAMIARARAERARSA